MQTSDKTAIVVGAGIIGLTSALRLAEAGYGVTIIERESKVCLGSSQANAGQLLYDRIGAMGSPGFLKGMPATVLNPDQGVSVLGLINPKRWAWAAAFLGQCTIGKWQENTRGLLALAGQSRLAMAEAQARYSLSFDWRRPGKLIVQPTQETLDAAALSAQFQAQFGGKHHVLSRAACFAKEPALQSSTRPIAGGIHLPDAEVGDCQKFGQGLARILSDQYEATFLYGHTAQRLVKSGDSVAAIETNKGDIQGDIFVLATGKSVHELLPRNRVQSKPIVGVKGVSLTYPVGVTPPDLSVTDAAGKFVIMRLGNQIRIAGYALFEDGGAIKAQHVRRLVHKAQALMPKAADYSVAPKIWVGIRPQTPDDLPMIGAVSSENLFVNAGHGSLGWTLAMGSATLLEEKIMARVKP